MKNPESVSLSVVIPVYNDTETLPILCDHFEKISPCSGDYEILFVDDSGGDSPSSRALEALRGRKAVRVLQLSRNFGQHVAIAAGLKNARGAHVLVMDSDLQYLPADAVKLHELALREKKDVVLSVHERRGHSLFKTAASHLFYRFMRFAGTPVTRDDLGAIFLLSRHAANGLSRMCDRYRFTITMVLWLTHDVAYCEVPHRRREHGESGYTLGKMLIHAATGVTSFSSKPLYISLFFSVVFGAGAFLGAAWIVAKVLILRQPFLAGWASTSVLILLCTAVILGCLGIIGLYLGRIFETTQGRPLYFVRGEEEAESLKLFEDR